MRTLCSRPRMIAALLLAIAPAAHAQFAVIDIASVTQLVTQAQTLAQQLDTARSQLGQAQAEYQSLTGDRGMQQLLGGTTRNYLPTDSAALGAAAAGAGAFPALATAVRAAVGTESVLTAAQLATLPGQGASVLAARRQNAALLAGLTQQALGNASARFASLQQLIDAIGRAADPKAALDLQARIAAENAMLQNESSKLQVLYQAARAADATSAVRARELTLAGHGDFGSRFAPQP